MRSILNSNKPDLVYNRCLELASQAERHAADAIRHRSLVRRALYRLAACYQRLCQDHHEWFLAQAESHGGFDALMDSWMSPLAFFGENWRDLLRDVCEGMTEAQYMASTAGSYLRKKTLATLIHRRVEEDEPETDPPDTIPKEEQLAILRSQNRTLRAQLRASRHECRQVRSIAARQEKRIAELESQANRVEKAMAHRKTG